MQCSVCSRPRLLRSSMKPHELCRCRKKPSVDTELPHRSMTVSGFVLYTLGVELEAAAWGSLALRDQQKGRFGGIPGTWYHDGSVTSGMEWASAPIPAKPLAKPNNAPWSGTGLVNDLLSIADEFDVNHLTTDQTCGLHVHLDMRELSYWELVKIWYNYIAIQNMVYRFSHPDRERINERRNRTYCNRYTPILMRTLGKLLKAGNTELKAWVTDQFFESSTEAIRDGVIRERRRNDTSNPRFNGPQPHTSTGITQRDLLAQKSHKYHNNRYYGLNIMSWFKQGTIEWRTQGHPYDSKDIVMWPLACCNMTNTMLNGPLLDKPMPNDLKVFLDWLRAPADIKTYLTTKYKQFEYAHETTTVKPTYKELV